MGKTVAVKDMCQCYSEGVLYHEINEPECFVLALAEKIGMKIKPSGVFDLLLEYLSDKYIHYHHIPQCPLEVTAIVMGVLQTAAEKYQKAWKNTCFIFRRSRSTCQM